jgi:phage-related protein
MRRVVFYVSPSGRNPVSEFISSLTMKQQGKVERIFDLAESYGLTYIQPYIKKLSGFPLWEIRILGKDNIRVLYVGRNQESILILHGFVKKRQKTPLKEIKIALDRLRNLKD